MEMKVLGLFNKTIYFRFLVQKCMNIFHSQQLLIYFKFKRQYFLLLYFLLIGVE